MTEADILQEADRVVSAALSASVDVRLIGGIAIARHCPTALRHPKLARSYVDIDLVVRPKSRRDVTELLKASGYAPDEQFNNLHGHARLLFYDLEHERQLDVFLGVFRMCHQLKLDDRFFDGYDAVPLADLALTKLQIVEINEKDIRDLTALFLDHDLGEGESPDVIDLARLRAVCCDDWGFYTTLQDNLERMATISGKFLSGDDHRVVTGKLATLGSELEGAGKSLKWRMRARLGRRAVWYEIPEEVSDAPA